MAILMLEGNQRFINTDKIRSAYVFGHEGDSPNVQIAIDLEGRSVTEPILIGHFKTFDQASTALQMLAEAISESSERLLEQRIDGVYR